MFSALLVPGLLQTEEYVRAIFSALRPDLSREEAERRVSFRMGRQLILQEPDPPELWVILDEAALRRPIGGAITMKAQLDHLVDMADHPKITLQILPFSAGAHAGLDGSFFIIRFPELGDPDVVYLEHPTADIYMEEPENIRRFTLLFDHLKASALDPKDSIEFIARLAERFL
jgi:hypothetical protein